MIIQSWLIRMLFKRGGDDKGVHTLLKDAISLKRLDGSSPSAQTKWNQITLSHILRHASP